MNTQQFYINGKWIDSVKSQTIEVIDPATKKLICHLANATPMDVDVAVQAATLSLLSLSIVSGYQYCHSYQCRG